MKIPYLKARAVAVPGREALRVLLEGATSQQDASQETTKKQGNRHIFLFELSTSNTTNGTSEAANMTAQLAAYMKKHQACRLQT